jgi:hypothetical protein
MVFILSVSRFTSTGRLFDVQSRSYLAVSCFGWLYLPEDGGSTYLRYVGGLNCRHIPGDQQNHKSIVLVFRTERWVLNPDVFVPSGDRAGNSLQRRAASRRGRTCVLYETAGRSAVESQNRLRTYGHPPPCYCRSHLVKQFAGSFHPVGRSVAVLLLAVARTEATEVCLVIGGHQGGVWTRNRGHGLVCIVLFAGSKKPSRALFGAFGERNLLFWYPKRRFYLKHLSV